MTPEQLAALFLKYGATSRLETDPGTETWFGWRAEAQLQELLQKPFSIKTIPMDSKDE
jgi:hypothetical protein